MAILCYRGNEQEDGLSEEDDGSVGSSRLAESLAALQIWSDARETWPSQREWDAYAKAHGYLGTLALLHHRQESWLSLCAALGGNRADPREHTECLAAIREASETLGPWMTKRQYDAWAQESSERPRLSVVVRRCGGRWNLAKAFAQLPQNMPSLHTHIWSESEMLDALRQAANALGDPFGEDAYEAWRGTERPSVETIRMHWGSLNTARMQATLMTQEPGGVVRYAEMDWQQAVHDFVASQITADRYGEWAQAQDAPSLTVLRTRIGGFRKALASIGLEHLPQSPMARDSNGSAQTSRNDSPGSGAADA